ncbi:formin isoform X2 [Syngnathoides biaculeatus]|uniref:formin isoform X2 n=1 Tax=Syngnathoides biaculeatus TaxID=300417 RepID=UPI002ADD8521|nr:formin isoform X2 [Syngnathoides biaculeatus]
MKGTDASMHLYIPFRGNEMSDLCTSLSRGPFCPSIEPQDHQPEQTHFYKEEGLVETAKLGLDKFRLTGSSELVWMKELLLLCSEYQTFMNMGNQQSIRSKTNVNSTEIRRPKMRTDGFVCTGTPLLHLKSPPHPPKPRRLPKFWRTSTPTIEDKFEEERNFICMPSTLPQERETKGDSVFEKDDGQIDFKHSKLSAKGSSCVTGKCPFSCREEETSSETDLSEYDDICSLFDSEPRIEEGNADRIQSKVNTQNEIVELNSQAATAARVMRKIEEVEGIIGRVSCTSSNWIRKNVKDESHSSKARCMDNKALHGPQIQTQDKDCKYDKRRLVDELRCLGEELSESLQRALKMEGENKEWLSLCTQREHESVNKNTPMRMPSYGRHISTAHNNSLAGCLSTSAGMPHRSPTLPLFTSRQNRRKDELCDRCALWTRLAKDSWSEKENVDWTNRRWREQTHRCLGEADVEQDDLLSPDEALQKQQEFWQREIEESLSFRRWFSHPSRPKLIDFLRITAPEDDISRTPSPVLPDLSSETSSPAEEEERIPGRLQAVWPPPKEEKIGLKYSEAEHQAALLQLKREFREEVEKLQEDFSQELCRLRLENEVTVSRMELSLAELRTKLSQLGTFRPGELRDVAVSTQDDIFPHKAFRTVCIQTDREAFVKNDDNGQKKACAQTHQQRVTPQKMDLASISLSLAGQREGGPPCHAPSDIIPPPPPLPCSTPLPTLKQPNVPPPPPPAPFMSHATPPPPPPPPFNSHLTSSTPPSLFATPRKPAVEPSCPMKPLYWTRIQIEDNKNNTLWNVLEEPHIMNAVEFEELFAKTTTRPKRRPLVENFEKTKAKKIIKLLDSKRSQAVGILISSLHLEMKDIRQAVLTVDNSVVDLETIEALYENRAQPEELEKIKTHYNTSQEEEVKFLDKPEQFLYELSQIPDFAGRARCVIFKAAFNDGLASIQHKLQILSCVSEALLEKDGVKEVLGLVLALGNHMNGGNRMRGQADGFGLEILPKLKDVKSRDNRISLVDYVVSYYLENVDKNAGTEKSAFPLPEPQDVFLAAQLNFEDLNAELRRIGRDLTGCENDVQKVCSDSPEEHLQPFKDRMETFLLSARKEHLGASYQLMTAQKRFQDLCVYFGLKPKTGETEVASGHFFMLWFEFCADFKARWKRENRNFTKERSGTAKRRMCNIG